MNSVQRSSSNFKAIGRGRGHQSSGVGRGQSQGSGSVPEHQRNRDSVYGSSSGTPPQHSSYPYDNNWRAHGSGNSRNYTRTSHTPPTPESPSQCPVLLADDETVKFIAEAWHEVEYDMKHPREGLNSPIVYQEKSLSRSRSDFEPFDLEDWHAKRVQRL